MIMHFCHPPIYRIIDASASLWSSSEAKESLKAASLSASAASEATKGLGSAVVAVQEAWEGVMVTSTEASTTDEYIGKVIDAIKSIFQSSKVKGALADVAGSSQKSSREAVTATGLLAAGLGKELRSSVKWNSVSSSGTT